MEHRITPSPPQEQQQQKELEITKRPLPTASISLSLLSSHLLSLSSPKPAPPPTHLSPFARLKIPPQISSLSFSLSTRPYYNNPPSKPRNVASHTPLLSPASLLRRRPADPSSAAGAARRCTLVWFRSDLRVHDHEPLAAASADSLSVLPVFLLDPRDYGKSASGFDKAGPRRAAFLLESVVDLRRGLRARGSDLVVRVGRPETALPELARAAGADAVYAHGEASRNEVAAEAAMAEAMEGDGVEVRWFWGSTLYHVDDLPFGVEDMPLNYSGFRERVTGVKVRDAIEAPDQIKGMPAQGDIEPGEIPTLLDLGLTPQAAVTQDGKPVTTAAPKGGETEALERLKVFAAEWRAQPPKEKKDNSQDSIYGANFSSKISPWLTLGCLSPRFVFEELKKTAARTIVGSSTCKDGDATGDGGVNWLMFELLWRDFFRFVTKKSSSTVRKLEAVPVPAYAGNLV